MKITTLTAAKVRTGNLMVDGQKYLKIGKNRTQSIKIKNTQFYF